MGNVSKAGLATLSSEVFLTGQRNFTSTLGFLLQNKVLLKEKGKRKEAKMTDKPRNASFMKEYNRRGILNILRKEAVSRAELTRRSKLSSAAVTLITDQLISDGLIFESETRNSQYGRRSVILDINPESRFAVGVDISRDDCIIGIINLRGQVLEKENVYITGMEPDMVIDYICRIINGIIRKAGIEQNKILGVGISTPGPIDSTYNKILNPPNFDKWHNMPIEKAFSEKIGYGICLENNSSALALAEKIYGAGNKFSNFILLVVSNGIGAGIVINGKRFSGVGGFGSEIGHTSINFDGELCSCGNRGCLELYASIPSLLKNLRNKNLRFTSWSEIVDSAEDGEQICADIIDLEARYLSTAIVNVANVLEPEAFILSGLITYKPKMLLERMRSYVYNSAITRNSRHLEILPTKIEKHAQVISAASIVVDRFFSNDSF